MTDRQGDPHKHHCDNPGDQQPAAGIDTVEHLVEHLAEIATETMAIVCVGNDLCGDDGAGPAIAERLADKLPWKVFNTQTVPESFLMKIVAASPESVLLIDALAFGGAPGAIELLAADSISGQGPSTHGPAPLAFLELLNMMHPCRCAVLGIQPANCDVGQPIGPAVAAAVDRVSQALIALAGR